MSLTQIKINFLYIILLCVTLGSCVSNNGEVFNELSTFANGLAKDSIIKFEFNVEDTSNAYNIDLLVRHDIDYPYYNLYLDCELGTDSVLNYKKVRELFLFDPSTGNPEGFNTFLTGKSLGGIYDHTFPLFGKIRFQEKGKYYISLKNYMRQDNPIKIHAIGLSIKNDTK